MKQHKEGTHNFLRDSFSLKIQCQMMAGTSWGAYHKYHALANHKMQSKVINVHDNTMAKTNFCCHQMNPS